MKIARAVTSFEPITITLESQQDVNLMFNAAMIANESGECNDEELQFTEDLATVLEPHIVVDEAVSGAQAE